MSTGYSSGYRSAMAWVRPSLGMGCAIHVPFIPNKPKSVNSDIYALDYWMYQHIHQSGMHRNLSSATHVFLPSSMKKKSKLVRLYKDKTFIINDFGPFCRFQHLRHYENVRFLLMSPGDGGCRDSKIDIISPHTVVLNDPTSQVERKYNTFFYGHLPKPYINPPISELRYRIYEDLHDLPNSIIGAYNVEENVNALTTTDRNQWCEKCSYQCKKCYFKKVLPAHRNAKILRATKYRSLMQASLFCIVARGDNPGCPKLAESIVSGCIPVIIMDQKLPFENELNYSAFAIRFVPRDVMRNPSMIKNALLKVTDEQIQKMQRQLNLVSDMFSVRTGGSPFNMQTKLLHNMCQ